MSASESILTASFIALFQDVCLIGINEVLDNSMNPNKTETEKYQFTTQAIEDDITYNRILSRHR